MRKTESLRSVLFLWSTWSSYMEECAAALRDAGVEVTVVAAAGDVRSPHPTTDWASELLEPEPLSSEDLVGLIRRLRPDVILVGGWHIKKYREALHKQPGSLRVLCMDNQWMETPKQWLGRFSSPMFIQRRFDRAFVAGERQYQFALRLGFSPQRIRQGLYIPSPAVRPTVHADREGFLFVGARVSEKNFDTLMQAYQQYRESSVDIEPWSLTIAGSGASIDADGIIDVGFISSSVELQAIYARTACSIMIGHYEPWGVALAEGAQAGHSLIAASEVGATPHLVHHLFNGYVVGSGDVDAVANAMSRIATSSPLKLAMWGERSQQLVAPYSAERWCAMVEDLLA